MPSSWWSGSTSDRTSASAPRCDRVERDEGLGRWTVEVRSPEGAEVLEADTVVFACGQLNRPHVPDLEGLDRFAGPTWHSARWDHRVDLAGKRVAVVGSGASAIQFVPPVAERGRRPHHLPAHAQLRGAEEGPGLPGADPASAGSGRTPGPGLPVVDLLEPRVPVDLVPQGQLGRPAARGSSSTSRSAPEWSPTGCPRRPWSPTTRSAASASSSPTTGTRPSCGPMSRWSTSPSTTSRPTPW